MKEESEYMQDSNSKEDESSFMYEPILIEK